MIKIMKQKLFIFMYFETTSIHYIQYIQNSTKSNYNTILPKTANAVYGLNMNIGGVKQCVQHVCYDSAHVSFSQLLLLKVIATFHYTLLFKRTTKSTRRNLLFPYLTIFCSSTFPLFSLPNYFKFKRFVIIVGSCYLSVVYFHKLQFLLDFRNE